MHNLLLLAITVWPKQKVVLITPEVQAGLGKLDNTAMTCINVPLAGRICHFFK